MLNDFGTIVSHLKDHNGDLKRFLCNSTDQPYMNFVFIFLLVILFFFFRFVCELCTVSPRRRFD